MKVLGVLIIGLLLVYSGLQDVKADQPDEAYKTGLKYKVKNWDEGLVVLNSEAKAIIEKRRGVHPTHVLSYRGHPVKKMNTKAWRRARDKVGACQRFRFMT